MTHHDVLGIIGTDHVNVLLLNLALDAPPAP
jgi:K+-transporting ATPase c subunit